MVPLNESEYAIDLARYAGAEVILVCRNYLGCINHSLLSIDYLIKSDFEIKRPHYPQTEGKIPRVPKGTRGILIISPISTFWNGWAC